MYTIPFTLQMDGYFRWNKGKIKIVLVSIWEFKTLNQTYNHPRKAFNFIIIIIIL